MATAQPAPTRGRESARHVGAPTTDTTTARASRVRKPYVQARMGEGATFADGSTARLFNRADGEPLALLADAGERGLVSTDLPRPRTRWTLPDAVTRLRRAGVDVEAEFEPMTAARRTARYRYRLRSPLTCTRMGGQADG